MDETEDFDDLPAILLDSSVADTTLSFEMPDARTIAAQRKLELEQDAEIKRYQEEIPMDVLEDATTTEITSKLETLQEIVPDVAMPFENPGIDLKSLNRMEVIDKFEGSRSLFLLELMDQLPECNDSALEQVLAWYLDSLERCIVEGPDGFEVEDIHCNAVTLALLTLDKRCRCRIDLARVRNLMMGLLNRVGRPHQGPKLLDHLTEHLLRIVPHFHDRLALADSFNVANVVPQDAASGEYFSSKLAAALSHGSLAQMLGYTRGTIENEYTVTELKELICNGSRWHLLNLYEQYYCLVFINNLLLRYTVLSASDSRSERDEAALNEMLQFMSTIKCKRNSGDFLKVKNLISKMKLLAQSKRGKDSGNVRPGDNPRVI